MTMKRNKHPNQQYSTDIRTCSGSANVGDDGQVVQVGGGGHTGQWGKIGFCPCGEYVAHQSNKPCNVIETANNKQYLPRPEDCTCKTEPCPCGHFVSHGVFEVCTALISGGNN